MSSRLGNLSFRSCRGSTCGRGRGSSAAALALVTFSIGCSFDLPAPSAGPGADAGSTPQDAQIGADIAVTPDADVSRPDGASDAGGAGPDATPNPDTGVDSGSPDAGFVDSGTPDAQPGPDATPSDVGTPDAGGCTVPPPSSPGIVNSFSLGHSVDRPLLLFDLTGDGQEELIAASGASSRVTVVEFDSCGQPSLTEQNNIDMGPEGPIGAFVSGAPRLVTLDGDRVRVYQYTPGSISETGDTTRFQNANLEFLSGDPSGDIVFVAGRDDNSNPMTWTFDGSWNVTPRQIGERVRQRPSFFGPYATTARFAGADAFSAILLTPDADAVFVADGGSVTPSSEVVVFRASTLTSGTHSLLFYSGDDSSGGTGQVLRMARVDESNLVDQQTDGQSLTAPFLSSPLLLVTSNEFFAFYVRNDDRLHGCSLTRTTVSINCTPPSGPLNLGNNAPSSGASPISSYVDNDDAPDLIVPLGNTGVLRFVTPQLGQAAADLTVGTSIVDTPAASEAFYDALGQQGTVVFVPTPGGDIVMVGWQTPAQAGPLSRLWPQWRRDAARSGSL